MQRGACVADPDCAERRGWEGSGRSTSTAEVMREKKEVQEKRRRGGRCGEHDVRSTTDARRSEKARQRWWWSVMVKASRVKRVTDSTPGGKCKVQAQPQRGREKEGRGSRQAARRPGGTDGRQSLRLEPTRARGGGGEGAARRAATSRRKATAAARGFKKGD
jgi:hypothetical protein